MKKVFTFLLLILASTTIAQKGTIRGSVIDNKSGEEIIGSTVIIKGTTTGTTTDLDGKFSFPADEGTYQLQISYISYQTIIIDDVKVKANEVTLLNNIRLKESTLEIAEVVVKAEIVRNNETALMTIKKKSAAMLDGISSEKMAQIGDGTAVEAAKRVTGVSVEGGKYVYVRGLGDRYSKTMLNGVDIPGLDPDRNSLQMDIFPTNLVNSITVSKNFMADLPADYTGGLLDIETKAFPDKKTISFSYGTAFNPNYHFNKNYLDYKGGKTDFLGFDDGTRALPAGANQPRVPTPTSGATREEIERFLRGFNPTLGASRKRSLLDLNLGFSIGNQIDLGSKKDKDTGKKLGYIFSLSYRNDYKFYTDVQYGEYQRFSDPTLTEMRYATVQSGEMGEHNVLLGAIGGLAYKSKNTKLRFTAMHLQNGESRAAKFKIDNDGEAVGQSGYLASSDNLEYNQRGLTNFLLQGTHILKNNKWEADWRVSPTISSSSDPDIRKTAFTERPIDTLFIAGAGGNPSRIWRSLSEINAVSRIDFTKKYSFKERDAKLKFGAYQLYKQRDYEILFFDIQFFANQNWTSTDPNDVLNPENLFPNRPNSIYYQSGNNNPNPNKYSSNINNTALYAMNELNLSKNLKTVLGLRAEYYVQRHTGRDQAFASGNTVNGNNLVNDKVLETLNFFPSVNFIYALGENQNLRLSYSRTVARPSFKEMSYAQIIDPITNRIFNGSLFEFRNLQTGEVSWDGQMKETDIDNLDFRWEMFLKNGQMFSISPFYKNFNNAIELVRVTGQQTSTEFQTRNVGRGQLFGLELEARKNLDFISPLLTNFNLFANVTLAHSSIKMTDIEFRARKIYEKDGETIKDTRRMAGQSPYVINAGISYNNFDKGTDIGLFYNVKGETLKIVGTGLSPDIYDEPFHSLNLSLNQKIGKKQMTTVDFKVANILNDRIEAFYQSFQAKKQVFNSLNPGVTFSFGLNHTF